MRSIAGTTLFVWAAQSERVDLSWMTLLVVMVFLLFFLDVTAIAAVKDFRIRLGDPVDRRRMKKDQTRE